MIEARGLSKYYGDKRAVDDVSFSITPGKVTGFVGPNGAGKSTSMRLMLGLDRPSAGTVTIHGEAYRNLPAPMAEVGALLDAKGVHPGRSARSHLRSLAATHGISDRRVDEVLGQTGLSDVAGRRVGGFSLGMGQRLGIAAALLGDPRVLILDEPVNGLDPDGVLWVRQLLRGLAREGRTVLLSSHLMSEIAQTADHIIVLGRGKVVADAPMTEFVSNGRSERLTVRTPDAAKLASLLLSGSKPEVRLEPINDSGFITTGLAASTVGGVAAQNGIELHELSPIAASLEDAYLALTRDHLEYATA